VNASGPDQPVGSVGPGEVPVFILAGGLGTRISEETTLKPKPMVEIGGIPILVHIMRHYYRYGFRDFVICAGYRSWEIKEYFLTYEYRVNHVAIDHRAHADSAPSCFGRRDSQERWRVRVIDTGSECATGGRVARAFDHVLADTPVPHFALTYGDGLCDVSLGGELAYHLDHGRIATVLGVPPRARFGELAVAEGDHVVSFAEKPHARDSLINGGFFFFRREVRTYLSDRGDCELEQTPLITLARDGQLRTFKHFGFWHPMDTLRDKLQLESLWVEGTAPWKPGGQGSG
jgi:glucose-1-phosphate cytidylyltransferase